MPKAALAADLSTESKGHDAPFGSDPAGNGIKVEVSGSLTLDKAGADKTGPKTKDPKNEVPPLGPTPPGSGIKVEVSGSLTLDKATDKTGSKMVSNT